MAFRLSGVKLFLFDMDGVLLVGKDRPRYVSGRKLIKRLKRMGRKVLILTNTSTHTRRGILRNLRRLGFQVSIDDIYTSSQLLAEYIHQRHGQLRCYVLGETGLKAALRSKGHKIVEDDAQAVVVGLDRRLNYSKLNRALTLLRKGAKLFATYMASIYMDEEGPALSAGPVAKALEYASGVKATAIGKPSPLMFKMALGLAGVEPSEALMVGDQIDTDIKGAKRLGIRTALVLTGVEKEESVRMSPIKPDLIVSRADDLLEYL